MSVMTEGNGATTGGEVRLADLEAALGRIPSITAARVVTGPGGRVTEVHVLAGRDRAPKQLVRDVQSVALASFGLEIDYRTVSVVQLDDPRPAQAPVQVSSRDPISLAAPRAALVRVATEVSAGATEVRVTILLDSNVLQGSARGPAGVGDVLVVRSVVDALSSLLEGSVIEVERAEIVDTGSNKIALCVVQMIMDERDVTIAGAAVVRRDAYDALARAALDALNRLISRQIARHETEHDAPAPSRAPEPA